MKDIKRRLDRLEKAAETETVGMGTDYPQRSLEAERLIGSDSELTDFVSYLFLNVLTVKAPDMPADYLPGCSSDWTRLDAWKLEHSPELRDASRHLVKKMLEINGNIGTWKEKGLIFIGQDGQPLPLLDAFMTRDVAEFIITENERRQLIEERPEEQAEIERLEKERDDTWTALQNRLKTNKYL